MRIALANWSCRRCGGAEAYLGRILPGLAARHEVAFLHELDSGPDREAIAALDRIPTWNVSELGDRALSGLRAWRPDVLYIHGLRDRKLEAELSAIAPAVLYAHDHVADCISGAKAFSFPHPRPCGRSLGPACLLHYYPRRCGGLSPATMWLMYQQANQRRNRLGGYRAILTASQYMRSEYQALGSAPQKIVTLPPPVAERLPRNEGADDGPTAAHVQLLFLGRMVPLKGGELLIRAAPRIAARLGRPVRVVMAGDGAARASWARLGAAVAHRNRAVVFEFAGWLGEGALRRVFDRTDLLVMPSIWPEPFGMSGPEAAAHGIPAAAFAVGGIPEWLQDGDNGHLAPADPPGAEALADAVTRCLGDREHYRRLRQGAFCRAATYDLGGHLGKLIQVLDEAAR